MGNTPHLKQLRAWGKRSACLTLVSVLKISSLSQPIFFKHSLQQRRDERLTVLSYNTPTFLSVDSFEVQFASWTKLCDSQAIYCCIIHSDFIISIKLEAFSTNEFSGIDHLHDHNILYLHDLEPEEPHNASISDFKVFFDMILSIPRHV